MQSGLLMHSGWPGTTERATLWQTYEVAFPSQPRRLPFSSPESIISPPKSKRFCSPAMLSEPHSSGGGDASGATGGALGMGGGGDGGLYARFHS